MNMASFIIYCVIVTFTPGPTNIAILSISNNSNMKKTFWFVCGAGAALASMIIASVIFNGILLLIVPKVLIIMRIAGCAYMLYLAYQVLKMNVSPAGYMKKVNFKAGLAMQFINPKVWIFTMTVIPSFVMPYYSATSMLVIFALIIALIAFFAMSAWALFGTLFKRFLQKYQKAINIILSLLLLYSAIEISGIIDLLKR